MKEENRESGGLVENLVVILVLMIASLPITLFWRPLVEIFSRKTSRFEYLSTLRMDELSDAIVTHGDFRDWNSGPGFATERELQKIVHHISFMGAFGAISEYPKLERLLREPAFWVYCNGYAENQKLTGIAVGFYLAIILVLIFKLLGS